MPSGLQCQYLNLKNYLTKAHPFLSYTQHFVASVVSLVDNYFGLFKLFLKKRLVCSICFERYLHILNDICLCHTGVLPRTVNFCCSSLGHQ